MNKEEYFNNMKEAKMHYMAEISRIQAQYATEHNPFKIGDIVEDPIDHTRIIIEKMEYTISHMTNIPYGVYMGTKVNEKNVAFKNKAKGTLYQCNNLIKID